MNLISSGRVFQLSIEATAMVKNDSNALGQWHTRFLQLDFIEAR